MSILHYNDQSNQPEATDWIGQLHKQLRGWIEAWQPIQPILGNLGWSLTTLAVRPSRRWRARSCSLGLRKRGFFREGTSGKTEKPLTWLKFDRSCSSPVQGETYSKAIGSVIIASTMKSHLHKSVSRAWIGWDDSLRLTSSPRDHVHCSNLCKQPLAWIIVSMVTTFSVTRSQHTSIPQT